MSTPTNTRPHPSYRWRPYWYDLPHGPRAILLVLMIWADRRGKCVASLEEMAEFWNWNTKTVERHVLWLLASKQRWIWRSPARERDSAGRIQVYRYWLDLERMDINPEACDWRARNEDGADPVDNPETIVPLTSPSLIRTIRQIVRAKPKRISKSADKKSADIGENHSEEYSLPRAPARAPISFPIPPYSWKNENQRCKAEVIAKACGPDIGEWAGQGQRLLKSLDNVLDGPWDAFDLELDVLPVVSRKTTGRSSKLWDFRLLTENIHAYRQQRLLGRRHRQ